LPVIVVDVMPKAELLDPQGKAVAGALARTGRANITGVRVGKRFELTVDGPIDESMRAEVTQLADEVLSNSVIEDVVGIHYQQTNVELAEAAAASHEGGYDGPAGETH
jgi:phosphoribosylformylglycinamidine synthase subunit PurS